MPSSRWSSAERTLAALVLLLSLAAFEAGRREWWTALYVDDSFITLRYAQNLVAGHGPVFNPGERVEGYSNPSWMLALAGATAAGFDPVAASRYLGLASGVALIAALFGGLSAVGVTPLGAALATLLLSSCQIFTAWSVAGLETSAYSLLLFSGLVLLVPRSSTRATSAAASLLLSLAALTRPEGIAFWLGGAAFVALFERRHLALYALPGSLLLLHLAWRYSYYGELLPNTYYVRAAGDAELWRVGLIELRALLLGSPNPHEYVNISSPHLAWLATAAACAVIAAGWLGQGRRVLLMALVVIFYLVYVVSTGGDSLGMFRYHAPALAPLAYLVGLAFTTTEHDRTHWLRPVLVVVVCALTLHSLAQLRAERRYQLDTHWRDGNVKLGRHLARTRPPDTLIAVPAAGAIPYFSRLPTIDMYGLTDAHIARQPHTDRISTNAIGHSKFDGRYVLSRKPELIVINLGYVPAGRPFAHIEAQPLRLRRGPMDEELFDLVYWSRDYELRAIDLGDGSRFYVFERSGTEASRSGAGDR